MKCNLLHLLCSLSWLTISSSVIFLEPNNFEIVLSTFEYAVVLFVGDDPVSNAWLSLWQRVSNVVGAENGVNVAVV
jgi:hypothetical protein